MDFQQELTSLLEGKVNTIGTDILWMEETDSTNLVCRRMAAEGAQEGLAVLARAQSAGRGRRGRSFQSTKDLGLYLSVLLRPTQNMEALSNMTAWVAVAVCRGLARACGVKAEIKWINDIILNGKKLGGILTELGLEQGKVDHLVVGIGINVNHTREDFDPDLRDMATALAQTVENLPSMPAIAAEIITALDEMYAGFPHNRAEYLEDYRAACISTGKPVQIFTPSSREQGESLHIDEEFRLVVRLDSGEVRALSAGEVSVRGMYGYV